VATKLGTTKYRATNERGKAVHSSAQAHPAKFTNERDERVPPVNCGPAKPPK